MRRWTAFDRRESSPLRINVDTSPRPSRNHAAEKNVVLRGGCSVLHGRQSIHGCVMSRCAEYQAYRSRTATDAGNVHLSSVHRTTPSPHVELAVERVAIDGTGSLSTPERIASASSVGVGVFRSTAAGEAPSFEHATDIITIPTMKAILNGTPVHSMPVRAVPAQVRS